MIVSFVTATRKCSHEDWIKGHQFRWLVIFGHYLGPLQFISRALRKIYDVSYKDFYTDILSYCEKYPNTYLGKEYLTIKNNLTNICWLRVGVTHSFFMGIDTKRWYRV